MTVEELIELLSELDPKLPVCHQSRGGTLDDVDVVEEQVSDDGSVERYVEIR